MVETSTGAKTDVAWNPRGRLDADHGLELRRILLTSACSSPPMARPPGRLVTGRHSTPQWSGPEGSRP